MNTADSENKKWETALRLIEGHDSLSDADIEQAAHDDGVQSAYRELLDCRQAVQSKYGDRHFNADAEWERFSRQTKRRNYRHLLIGGAIGVAATMLLVFGLTFLLKKDYEMPAGVMVYQSNDSPQVVLLSANGDELPLTDTRSMMPISGVRTSGTGSNVRSLDYRGVAAKGASSHELTTPRGKDFELILSDGTKVWLNADSRLNYPSRFEGEQRVVSLQGEAFFEVAKDSSRPFIVQTKNFETKVLGTKFNVRSYSDEDSHVTLIDGCVDVKHLKSGSTARLEPGDDAHFMPDGTIQTEKVDVDSYVYWKEGFFYFDNVSLVDIMQTLGRWYNVNVIFSNTAAMKYRLHFLCDRNGGVEHAVMLLNRMEKAKIRFDKKSIIVD